MARQRRPEKQPQPEQASTLARAVRVVSDWRVIVGAIVGVFLFGGTVYAFVGKFATKVELGAVKGDIQTHNAELAGIHQSISDFSDNQKQMMDWVRDIYQHPRK